MDDPQLQAQLEIFAPEYQEFVISPIPEMMARAYGEPLGLTDKELNVLENGFILYLLAMISKSEWVDFISAYTTLNGEISQSTVDEMGRFVSPELEAELGKIRMQATKSAEDIAYSHNSMQQNTNLVSQPTATQAEEPIQQKQTDPTLVARQRENLLKEIEEAEEKLASISPIRTMQTDYQQTKEGSDADEDESKRKDDETSEQPTESIPRGSSQEELLNKKKGQYADLRPHDNDGLRWESDNS